MFFHFPPSNPDNKVPLNLAYHRANILQLRSVPISSSSMSLRPLIRLLDTVKGYCGTVKMSCTELVYAIHGAIIFQNQSIRAFLPLIPFNYFFIKLPTFILTSNARLFRVIKIDF